MASDQGLRRRHKAESSSGPGTYIADPGESLHDASPMSELRQVPLGTVLAAERTIGKRKRQETSSSLTVESTSLQRQPKRSSERASAAGAKELRHASSSKTSKHAPVEMSARRPVSRKRDIVDTHDHAKKARDPRFDPLSGSFRKDLFKKSYAFLSEQRDKELQELESTVAKAEKRRKVDVDELEGMKLALTRKKSQKAEADKREREERALQEWKRQERAKQSEGKQAWYLKPAAKKDVLLKAQFEDLSGDRSRLRKVMERKQRKVDQKDKKKLPTRR